MRLAQRITQLKESINILATGCETVIALMYVQRFAAITKDEVAIFYPRLKMQDRCTRVSIRVKRRPKELFGADQTNTTTARIKIAANASFVNGIGVHPASICTTGRRER